MRRAPLLCLMAPVLVLSGCGGADYGPLQSTPVARSPVPRTKPRPPVRQPLAPPPVQALPGVEGVIGATRAELTRQFGLPRLDVLEGDARKLQYSGSACVLDIYLYPPAAGREPQASYVDARRASDGLDVDRVACIAAIRRGGGAPKSP